MENSLTNKKYLMPKGELRKVTAVATRMVVEDNRFDLTDSIITLSVVHLNGNPLDFDKMLSVDISDLAHDVIGIMDNMCRDTGRLLNDFIPKFSIK